MATARTAAPSLRTRADGLAWVCDLASHPVPTFVARAPDGRLAVVEQLSTEGRPVLSRQAQALSRLNHPNLVRVRSVAAGIGVVELVSDYVKGESLAEFDRLADVASEPIPLEIKLRIVVDVLNGLFALHGQTTPGAVPSSAGLVHGNVRPENIVVGLDGVTRLVRPLLPRSKLPNPYAAPELTLSEGDARADLFSVGVILERALGKAGASEKVWGAPFAEVVARATQPSREARFATAAQMAAEIRKIAKAKLASSLIVAAAVEEIAGDHLDEREQRLAREPTRVAGQSGTARIGPFPEEAPTVPRKPPPELLRPPLPPSQRPLPSVVTTPRAPHTPPASPMTKGSAPPVPKPTVSLMKPPVEAVEVPPPPPEIAALATPLVADTEQGETVHPEAVVAVTDSSNDGSEAAVAIAILEPAPPVDVLLLPPEASVSETPALGSRLGPVRARRVAFAVLAAAFMILLVAGIRSATRGQALGAEARSAASTPSEPAPTAATLPPSSPPDPPHVDPPAPAPAPPTSTPSISEDTAATRPISVPPAHSPPAASPPVKKAPSAPAKPAATYDPLGI
jgi:hypothetical protein